MDKGYIMTIYQLTKTDQDDEISFYSSYYNIEDGLHALMDISGTNHISHNGNTDVWYVEFATINTAFALTPHIVKGI